MDFYDIKLGDCLSMIENGATIKQQKGSKGLPITRIETLSNNRFNRDRLGYADIFDANKYSHYILDDKDILMSHINSKAFLGRSVLYKRHGNEQIIHGMNVLRIKTKKDVLDQEYAYYYFQTSFFKKNIHNIRKDAVNQSSINISDIKDIIIQIPSLKDQKNIVTVLSNIDCKIALNRQINDNLEAMARQLYDYWFVQFDFPDENGRPYKSSGGKMVWNEKLKREMPEGWKICPLSELLKINDARRIPLSNKQRAERQCIYPYYGATGIMDYVDDFLFDEDLLLLAEDGSTSDGKGHPIVQYIWGKNWVNNHAHILKPKYAGQLYYYYFVLKQIPVALIETGSIQKKISQQNLLSYRVAVSPENLIQAFSNVANVLQEQRKKNFDEIDCLTKQRDELLPLLMNGQATVNYHLSDD